MTILSMWEGLISSGMWGPESRAGQVLGEASSGGGMGRMRQRWDRRSRTVCEVTVAWGGGGRRRGSLHSVSGKDDRDKSPGKTDDSCGHGLGKCSRFSPTGFYFYF